ncbi:hypothetical protein [Pontiella agarivorans]|uniref:Transposase n=1 Tax=Pontiella agarivorans TaxID=3038953 RepID=A0ABU5MTW1_9BACT|nr:hypothetical protein [Pontiella agarivorans]MDZ8117664.1 hypothetical protein [Pontiella agarivorans]
MAKVRYYLETEPQSWSGVRQMHAAGCALMPEKKQLKALGAFATALNAMSEARKIYRRANGCSCCCKA